VIEQVNSEAAYPSTIDKYHTRHVKRLADGVRPVRVMHALDGIEQEVPPAMVTEVGHALWDAWRGHPDFQPADLLLGLDAGGILPTLALSAACGTPYRLAWRLDLDLPDKHVFLEPHSALPELYLYGCFEGKRVLIVDDEVTTGRTAVNLRNVLIAAQAAVVGVACLVEDTSGRARARLAALELPLCSLTSL
jgi:adenine phosphoribosyltransferase